MSKVNATIVYMLTSFIFLVSVIIPQFVNAQEVVPKINEQQREALELFSKSQSLYQHQIGTDQIDKKFDTIFNSQSQEQGMPQQQQQPADNDNNQMNVLNSKSVKEHSQKQEQQKIQQNNIKIKI